MRRLAWIALAGLALALYGCKGQASAADNSAPGSSASATGATKDGHGATSNDQLSVNPNYHGN